MGHMEVLRPKGVLAAIFLVSTALVLNPIIFLGGQMTNYKGKQD
jgi:hypothetical protein